MRINTNVSALRALNNLSSSNAENERSIAKLSSGFRITRAADDAAGLGIANVLRGTIKAMGQASRNADQANSVLNIAEGAAGSIQKMLERMQELATQAASDSVDADGRARVNTEFQNLISEVTRTVDTTKFQGNKLVDGTLGGTVTSAYTTAGNTNGVQAVKLSGISAATVTFSASNNTITASAVTAGATTTQSIALSANGQQTLNFSSLGFALETNSTFTSATLGTSSFTTSAGNGTFLISASGQHSGQDKISLAASSLNLTASNLGVGSLSVDTLANAQAALTAITGDNGAIEKVATTLGYIGGLQNQLENAQSNLKTAIQNFSAAESTIRDLDMAEEMTKFSKNQILSQAGTAMLAQANQSTQGVLQLLRG